MTFTLGKSLMAISFLVQSTASGKMSSQTVILTNPQAATLTERKAQMIQTSLTGRPFKDLCFSFGLRDSEILGHTTDQRQSCGSPVPTDTTSVHKVRESCGRGDRKIDRARRRGRLLGDCASQKCQKLHQVSPTGMTEHELKGNTSRHVNGYRGNTISPHDKELQTAEET